MSIHSVNLSLSNRCTANCIFCPVTRGQKINMDMPIEIVSKILNEVSSPTFPWKVNNFYVGENGDALLNSEFLDILRLIRTKMPLATIILSSNFSQMKPEISNRILNENLLDEISVNIDGHNSDSYTAQKKLNYENVIINLKYFVNLRSKFENQVKLIVHVLTLKEYAKTVLSRLGKIPIKLKKCTEIPESSFALIEDGLRKWMPLDIIIDHPGCFLWAERSYVPENLNQTHLICPRYDRIISESWIAPNGDWYACCLDDNQDIIFGNVMRTSLYEIHESIERFNFIYKITNRMYKQIGKPCNTIVCCF